MESALFRDFFGNFSTQGEKYYFCVDGSMQGVFEMNIRKTQNSEKLKFLFWVEGSIWWVWQGVGVTWGGSCKVGYARWIMWGGLHEVDHARWVTRGGSHEVGYVRWVTWGGLCEVGYARWITRGTSHLVKCFTPWYFIILKLHYFKVGRVINFPNESLNKFIAISILKWNVIHVFSYLCYNKKAQVLCTLIIIF